MKSPTVIFLLLALVGAGHCQPDDGIPSLDASEKACLRMFKELPASAQVHPAPDNEPGSPLVICGKLLRKLDGNPVAHASLLVYHTDVKGDYQQRVKGKPETARISGRVETDEKGRFLISTILPGKYNNKGAGGHIHLQVEGAKPGGYTFQFTQYSTLSDKKFISGNGQFFLVELKRDEQGRLVGFLDLPVKGM
ncbi:MAG: hypothetical protein H6558_01170 [Lewinellaceae bacterium]|nr:hypothetical protein [Lewinellaceae bacterium]MCB9287505.1 hypothetical protein [Lewinellaceae bacterium]